MINPEPRPDDAVADVLGRLRTPGRRPLFPLEAEAESALERAEVEAALRAVATTAPLRFLEHPVAPAPRPGSTASSGGVGPPAGDALIRDPWGDPTPADHLAPEADACPRSTRARIARLLEPEAWRKADASLEMADAILALIEGGKTP